ncbi:hypothetical protein [Rhodopseudomonas palustris]
MISINLVVGFSAVRSAAAAIVDATVDRLLDAAATALRLMDEYRWLAAAAAAAIPLPGHRRVGGALQVVRIRRKP